MRAYFTPLLALLICTLPAAVQSQQVYRCGSSYSQTPCPGGHAIDDKLSTLHGSTTAAPGQATVYLCQGQGGGEFWSREHCSKHQAVIDRMETVPASLPWAQQVQQAQRQREQARTLTQPANERRREEYGSTRRTGSASERSQVTRLARQERQDAQRDAKQAAACAAAQNHIAQLDRQGRAGGSAREMEQQRQARRKATADLQRLGC